MDIFNVVCGACSVVGLLVSVFTASKVIKISQTINSGNTTKDTKINTKLHKSEIHGDVVGGNKNEWKNNN